MKQRHRRSVNFNAEQAEMIDELEMLAKEQFGTTLSTTAAISIAIAAWIRNYKMFKEAHEPEE